MLEKVIDQRDGLKDFFLRKPVSETPMNSKELGLTY
jgi:hypothetical protein